MSIVLLGSTSGSCTLQEQAVAGTTTLTLPTTSGTVALTSQLPTAPSAVGQVLFSTDGSTYTPTAKIVSGTAVTLTTQTSVDYTSIPSWVKRITVMFTGVSTNGTSNIIVQLGTGSTPTYTTSGYLGNCATDTASTRANMSTGFLLTQGTASGQIFNGNVYINFLGSNTWCENGMLGRSDAVGGGNSAGSVPLAAALTAIRLTTVNGTDQFDAGTINILYE